ncbi:type IV secretory system conjugative DNA transfer family protein [Pantoea agglomerans]|uniref:type IV secretory system conjugative DNA transfer family protein n=1 Tax=Enterobacter agglomerans TaxID=549 RepID=UPI003BFA6B19
MSKTRRTKHPIRNTLTPRPGKGVAYTIPTLLTFPDSVVVSDPHHDLWERVESWKPGKIQR